MKLLLSLAGVFTLGVSVLQAGDVDPLHKDLRDYFKDCKTSRPDFDQCMKRALNDVTPLFRTGVPEYGIQPFDPLFMPHVNTSWGSSVANITYRMSNIVERDWTKAHFIQFKSNLEDDWIQFTMLFPDKRISGDYDIEVSVAGTSFRRAGGFHFRFFDYVKTTTARRPREVKDGEVKYGPIQVEIATRGVRDMFLEYTNLEHGTTVIEEQLNNFINANARAIYGLQLPMIDEMGGKALTETYRNSFKDFPFDTFFS